MKRSYFFIGVFCSLMLLLSPRLYAQQLEMNASSPELVEKMRATIALMGHDMDQFGIQVEEIYQMDPTMPMANVFMAVNPDNDADAAQPYIQAFLNYEGELTPAEQVFKGMLSHFDDEDYEAAPEIMKLAEMYPNDPLANFMAGFANLVEQNPQEAVSYLEKALSLQPLPGAYNLMGYMYMQMGQMDKAKEYLEGYMAAAPDHHNPYDSMGDFLMAVKDYEGAAQAFERAAAINPAGEYHKEKAAKAREMMNK